MSLESFMSNPFRVLYHKIEGKAADNHNLLCPALLTRTGPGTPCGRLLRSYWQPIAAAEEMPMGGDPLPIRVMSEDLVLFRDDKDRLGLIGQFCPHRGTDLSYGRVEDGGLRCSVGSSSVSS